jgi:hypothetical protein
MKTCEGINVQIHVFLTSALVLGEWSASRPGRFTPGERAPGTRWIGGCVRLRASLHDVEKIKFLTLPGLEFRSLGRPARSQSLYRLCYPGCSQNVQVYNKQHHISKPVRILHNIHIIIISQSLIRALIINPETLIGYIGRTPKHPTYMLQYKYTNNQ